MLNPYLVRSQKAELHFNGRKYELKIDSSKIYIENLSYCQLKAKNRPFFYKFCGRGFLKKETVAISYGDPNIEDQATMIYLDSCVTYTVIDSIKIEILKDDLTFIFDLGSKDLSIYSFTLYADSSTMEYKFLNRNSNLDKTEYDFKYSSSEALKSLKRIINQNSNSTKFLLSEIIFYDEKAKKDYRTSFGILLTR